jgi:hypothetical protein
MIYIHHPKSLKSKENTMERPNQKYIELLEKAVRECTLFGFTSNMRYYQKLLNIEKKKGQK